MRILLAVLLLAGCSKSFDDYAKKSKLTEAELELNKLGKSVKAYAMEKGELPKLSIPLTPAEPCCASKGQKSGYKCESTASTWAAWQPLDFMILDPHYFQYSVESDGKTLTAKAVGDLDCDTAMVEYVMVATMVEGNVTTELTKPQPNAD
jgi:hypothetical protein